MHCLLQNMIVLYIGKEEATCWKLLGADSKSGKPCTSYHWCCST